MQQQFTRRRIIKVRDNEIHVRELDGEWNTYWAPTDGGYIRNTTHQPGTLGSQICYKDGSTLEWNGKSDLKEVLKPWLNRKTIWNS